MRHLRAAGTSVFVALGVSLVLLAAGCSAPGECGGGACVRPATCMPGEASAQFRDQVAPPSLIVPMHRAQVSVTFANCSGQTWRAGEFALRPGRGVGVAVWGVARVDFPNDVADGQEVTIPFEVRAPV